jgi:hypothetical protein
MRATDSPILMTVLTPSLCLSPNSPLASSQHNGQVPCGGLNKARVGPGRAVTQRPLAPKIAPAHHAGAIGRYARYELLPCFVLATGRFYRSLSWTPPLIMPGIYLDPTTIIVVANHS